MNERGPECPKEAGYIGLVSYLTKYTCQFKVLFKFCCLVVIWGKKTK